MDNLLLVQRINSVLSAKGIPKGTFYSDCGITSAAYSQWKTGKTSPAFDTLRKIADYLDVPVESLLADDPNKKSPTTQSMSSEALDEARLKLLASVDGMTMEQVYKMIDLVESAKKLI